MLGLPPSVRIHFATALVDMRKGIDGLRTRAEATTSGSTSMVTDFPTP
jgi:hypothetical protein